jgi:hypothetical protein
LRTSVLTAGEAGARVHLVRVSVAACSTCVRVGICRSHCRTFGIGRQLVRVSGECRARFCDVLVQAVRVICLSRVRQVESATTDSRRRQAGVG